jgi:transcriptional regulator with XRE-family HTH domain
MHGDNIKKRRSELGLTLLEVAERIGVKEATVQRYESGAIKNIKYDMLIKLSAALETTPTVLMGWDIKSPAALSDDETRFLDDELVNSLCRLSPDKLEIVKAFLQGLESGNKN